MTLRNFSNSTSNGMLVNPVAGSTTTLTVSGFTNPPTAPFTITIDRNTATEEICLVTAVVGSNLTVTRGYDGTSQTSHSAGAAVEHTAGAIEFSEANAHNNATSGVHGTTGALVGATGSQTIFSKTLVSPVSQADPVYGDAIVLYIPSGATSKNFLSAMNSSGTTVFYVDSTGKLFPAALSVSGLAALNGNTTVGGTLGVTGLLTATGGVTLPGAAALSVGGAATTAALTVSGAATFSAAGSVALNNGATVPTGKDITLTDAPVNATDAANKAYVDGAVKPTTWATQTMTGTTTGTSVQNRTRDGGKTTEFRGVAVFSSAISAWPTQIGTLSAGNTPKQDYFFLGKSNGSNIGILRFGADGTIKIWDAVSRTGVTQVQFDGIAYDPTA